MSFIPYSCQSISRSDIDEVVDVLNSDFLTTGPKIPEFEEAICAYVGAKYGVAVSNATAALHVACLALGVKEGDMVIAPQHLLHYTEPHKSDRPKRIISWDMDIIE